MKFHELNDKQKVKALDKFRDINVDHDNWNDSVKEEHTSALTTIGFECVDSQYSGFCSQGDGASFSATNVNLETFLRSQKRWSLYRVLHKLIKELVVTASVSRSGSRYSHSNTTKAELYTYWEDNLTIAQKEKYDELESELDEFITTAGDNYYRALEEEYDYLTSDNVVQETIEANEYDFEVTDNSVTYI